MSFCGGWLPFQPITQTHTIHTNETVNYMINGIVSHEFLVMTFKTLLVGGIGMSVRAGYHPILGESWQW